MTTNNETNEIDRVHSFNKAKHQALVEAEAGIDMSEEEEE